MSLNTSKTTILVLTSSFPRWSGDTDSCFVYELSQRLSKTFNVIILCPHTKHSKFHENIKNCKVYRFKYAPEPLETLAYNGGILANLQKSKLNYLLLPFFFISQIIFIIKLIRKYDIKIIHAHWLIPQGISARIALSFFSRKIKLITTSHGGDLFSLGGRISQFIKSQVIHRSERITVVSQIMKKNIYSKFKQPIPPIDIISMGIDLQQTFIPNETIKRNKNQLLFVGRLVEKKGVSTLLQTISILLPQKPDIKLIIIGSGPDEDCLKKRSKQLGLENNIQFLGHISPSELPYYYHHASVSVFPFQIAKNGDQEGLGLVVIEAMGCGCPVIAGNVPAVYDTVIDGETGILVPPKNINVFARKLGALLDDTTLQKKLSISARAHVLKNYDWEYIAQQYTQLFQKIDTKKFT